VDFSVVAKQLCRVVEATDTFATKVWTPAREGMFVSRVAKKESVELYVPSLHTYFMS
jgi:hypothetical protein